ncbi:MAG: BMC domain-containing protein [Planctomycetes bacterium]|nr:BMC domain-containing protein [Planctomycetota bacterium]
MYRRALGIIETVGLVGSVEAADAMTKCADVELVGREEIGGGLFAVAIRGDVGSVRAALESGSLHAKAVGELHGVLLIPRPSDDLDTILTGFSGSPPEPDLPRISDLPSLNVHQLRSLARRLPHFPLKGREISMAHREELLDRLKEALEAEDAPNGS